ncbi:phage tail tip protein [Klebsiella pneumoniae]
MTNNHPFNHQIIILPLTFHKNKHTINNKTTYSIYS